jgi:CelD/BcsL family acetyltransferase involved in cellulose biosynthesis
MWTAYADLGRTGGPKPTAAGAGTATAIPPSVEIAPPVPAASAGRQMHPCGTADLRLAVVTDREGFECLEQPWNELFDRAGRACQLFQSFDWLRHWANHYLDNGSRLSVVTGWRHGRLVLVWPLVATRSAGLTRLSWMGEPVSQYGDVLVENGPARLDLLRRSWARVKMLAADIIYLRKIRSDAAVSVLLPEMGAIRTSSSQAPYLDLASASDFETYNQRYSGKRRSDRRRHLRRLKEAGPITFEQHACGAAAQDLVSRALQHKRAWLVQRGLIFPVLHDESFEHFFRDVVAGHLSSPAARISAIRCNGEPIGVEISFSCKGDIFGVLISHDLKFERQGLGAVLAEFSIRTAHAAGYAKFDLLAPAEPYKMDWADGAIDLADWAVPFSGAARFYTRAWLGGARGWAKNVAHGLPPWLGRMLISIFGLLRTRPGAWRNVPR